MLGAVLCWSRLVGLERSLWWDETYAVVTAIELGPAGIWLGGYEPNNHVAAAVLGPTERVYRLWSVLPALGPPRR